MREEGAERWQEAEHQEVEQSVLEMLPKAWNIDTNEDSHVEGGIFTGTQTKNYRQPMTAGGGEGWRGLASLRAEPHPLLAIQCRVVVPEAIYAQITKADSACVCVHTHTHTYKSRHTYVTIKKKSGYQLQSEGQGGVQRKVA